MPSGSVDIPDRRGHTSTTNEPTSLSVDRFQILALDGGGAKALFTAHVLARLEQDLGVSINDSFDLIAGTSAGGMSRSGWVPVSPLARSWGTTKNWSRLSSRPRVGDSGGGLVNSLHPSTTPSRCAPP